MDSQRVYQSLGHLLETAPELRGIAYQDRVSNDTLQWLAKLQALLDVAQYLQEAVTVRAKSSQLGGVKSEAAGAAIMSALYAALAKAELLAPVVSQGAFIPAGGKFDAFSAVQKVVGGATTNILIVDPYMDETVVTDFASLVPEAIPVRLLTDSSTAKPGFAPAVVRWNAQYGATRPLTARATAPRALHDRLILVDDADAWILTQSLKDLAVRSHASLTRSSPDIAGLKISAYQALWDASSPIG